MTEDLYHIRFARAEELPAIQQIEIAAASLFRNTDYFFVTDFDPMPLDFLVARQKDGHILVAADCDDRAAGFLIMRMIDGAIYIHELDVHPSHGRRGLGRRLISAACDRARNAGCRAVMLSTFRDIEWNAPFYARLGFRILSDEELSPALIEVRRKEAKMGMPLDKRVCMRLEL